MGFRNKTGFHECPQCRSRSVWKADPYGTLEETLHRLLKLSPYRCARCDRRFLDAKIPAPESQRFPLTRWFSRAFSTATRALTRTPLDEAFRLYSIFGQALTPTGCMSQSLKDRSIGRQPSAASDSGGLGENSGMRA
jgi:DNA-directed RNA polymerase subunit RPC12/RpoP